MTVLGRSKFSLLLALIFATTTLLSSGSAQPPEQEPAVRLTVQGEMPLQELVEYVAQRLGLRVVYDPTVLQKKIHLIAPDPIPIKGLSEVLQSLLRNEGLVLAEPDSSGVQRIIQLERLPEIARPSRSTEDLREAGASVPLVQIFSLKHSSGERIVEFITPFLSRQGASIVALEGQPVVVVTDIAENVRRAAELIEILDTGRPLVDTKFVPVKFVSAEELAKQLQELLAAQARAVGRPTTAASGIEVTVHPRTNQIVLIGNTGEVSRAIELLEAIDTELPTSQQSFAVQFISPERLDQVVRSMLDGRVLRPPYRSHVEGNVLIIDSTEEVFELTRNIRLELDTREAPAGQSPIRYYKIRNVPAPELAQTIQSLGGASTGAIPRRERLPNRRITSNDRAVPGPNLPPGALPGFDFPGSVVLPTPPAQIPALTDSQSARGGLLDASQMPLPSEINRVPLGEGLSSRNELAIENPLIPSLIGEATITVDVNTNTIIVVAAPEVQRIFASLIETLDKRRPQVLVEAKVVIVDTSDNYSLGVEISGGDRLGLRRAFAFNSYGLSQVDAVTGALTVIPGLGFNGTLVDPTTADAVIRALAVHRRARVLSTPKILVNDNAEGQLTSVLEIPFTSVNASQTVATTSFAGFAEAGTTITVTPTISEDDHLQLDYVVTLNSFTAQGTQGVPPPRQTNEVRSRITIPDGYTVVVGGLTSKNATYAISSIPWLEKIPIIRELTSLQSDDRQSTTLFVFLKPMILREDRFKDLKYLSESELDKACLPTDLPTSAPLLID